MKSVFGGGFRGKGDDDGPRLVFTGGRALFPLLKWALIGAGTMVALVVFFSSVMKATRIAAGYEGVEINLAGSQRGAADIPIRTGWVFYGPLRTQIIEFPTLCRR